MKLMFTVHQRFLKYICKDKSIVNISKNASECVAQTLVTQCTQKINKSEVK